MINLLPPERKQQIAYSKYNVIARRYVLGLLAVIVLSGSALLASHWYADEQIQAQETALAGVTAEIAGYQELEANVANLNTELRTIETLINRRPEFSLLLQEMAEVLPSGSFINGITLNQATDQPVTLTITAPSTDQAIIIRNALVQSPRIASADIQTITPAAGSDDVNITVVIAINEEDPS